MEVSFVTLVRLIAFRGWEPYHFDLALAVVLDAEGERFLKTTGRVVECEESLVWLLAGLALGGSEDDLEGVGSRQADGRGKSRGQ